MLTLSLGDAASRALAVLPDRLRDALAEKANAIAAALAVRVQQKLAGDVLGARSGALARSIVATITDTPTAISVRIASASADVRYAAIHEYGGTIPPHDIVPDKARALAFVLGGKQAFAERARLPAVTMPERSYMRSSLAEMADVIRDQLAEAAVGAAGS